MEVIKIIIVSIIIGIIIGGILTILTFKRTQLWERCKVYFKQHFIEGIMMMICGVFIFSSLVSSFLNINLSNEFLFEGLSFFSSIIFAWLLANYSNEKNFKNKNQELAIKSYRHSIQVKNSLDYSIETSNLMLEEISDIRNEDINNSKYLELTKQSSEYILRLRDALITAQMNSTSNIDDWSDAFSEQLLLIENLEKLDNRKKKLEQSKQGYDAISIDWNSYINTIDNRLKEIDIEITQISKKINSNLLLASRQEENLKIAHMKYINYEKEHKKAMKLKENIKTNRFKSRVHYNEALSEVANSKDGENLDI